MIRQKYDIQQEPSLFKGHPFSYSMAKNYVQWFILKSVYEIAVCEKLDFAFLSLGGPIHGARVWCLGRVPKHRNQWQEVEGLLFSPQNSQLVHILSFHS